MLNGSKPKAHRKYIQDIVTFLKNEALALEEAVKYEHKQNGSDHTVRVSIGGDSVEAKRKTLKTAKEAAARDMMAMIGPWVEEEDWRLQVERLTECVPAAFANSWLPPVFDARQLRVEDANWYEVEVQLGPLTVVSVTEGLSTSLDSLIEHTSNFLKSRNMEALLRIPIEEGLGEMEVAAHMNQPYVQSRNLLEVRMDNGDKETVLPAVDLFTMQLHLPDGGQFPPSYGAEDMHGCRKVFKCKVTGQEFSGVHNLVSHVRSINYWRRLGKFFLNGQLRETFNPRSEPSTQAEAVWQETEADRQLRLSCAPRLCSRCDKEGRRSLALYEAEAEFLRPECLLELLRNKANTKFTQLPLPNVIHPVQDLQQGKMVDKTNLKYLIAVYRCVDMVQPPPPITSNSKSEEKEDNKPQSLMSVNVEEPSGPAKAFKPPEAGQNGGGFGNMYQGQERNGFKMGWEDPTQAQGPGGQFGFGPRGGGPGWGPHMGGGYGPGPPMGYGGHYGPGPMGGGYGGPRMRFNNPGGFGPRQPRPPVPSNVPGPSNPEAVGMKRKITAEKKLEKYSGGELVMPEGEEEAGNSAYTGKVGKTGFSEKNKKETARYAALPPPGHNQWNNISGNENFKIDNSMANLKPVGANFKAKGRVQMPKPLVMAKFSPQGQDSSGFRMAPEPVKNMESSSQEASSGQTQSADKKEQGKNKYLEEIQCNNAIMSYDITTHFVLFSGEGVSDDWFSAGTSEVKMRSIDQEAIMKSIQSAKTKMGSMETDFTKVKRKSKWD